MMNILVVDDDILNLKIVESYLKRISGSYNIFLCQRPDDVFAMISEKDIDIIFLDIIMPGISGMEVLEKIRSDPSLNDIQVIMLTGMDNEEYFKACFDRGADDFLKKPVNEIELQARLKAAIKTRTNAKIIREMLAKLKAQNTELKELNKTLSETQFHMIQKEKLAAIGELAAGIAHEINNPLGFVSSNIETLLNFSGKLREIIRVYRQSFSRLGQAAALSPSDREIFDEVQLAEKKFKLDFVLEETDLAIKDSRDGIERVSKIVQSLKNFARSGFENELVLNDINGIIEEALLIVRNEAKYTIDIHTSLGEIPEVLCNRGQIGQVVLNMLMNSIQAIKSQHRPERGNIRIETEQAEEHVYITISDDGPGIPEDILNRIFDPFFTTKEVGEGTGLGLSISHDIIVNKHNGEIYAGNNPEGGACFKIKLPVNPAGVQPDAHKG